MLAASRRMLVTIAVCVLVVLLDVAGFGQSLVVSIRSNDLEYDPHRATTATEAQIFTALYEGLVSYDPRTLEPVPAVAKSWEISEDRRHVTFFLRTEARFETGDPILADDVRASWLRLLDPSDPGAYSFLLDSIVGARAYRTGRTADPSEVRIHVRGSRILKLELVRPDPSLLQILAHHALVPLHRSRRERSEPFAGAAPLVIGNGPYRMRPITPEGDYELVASERYWDRASVYVPRIVVRRSLDADATTVAFNSGELDWALSDFSMQLLSNIDALRVNTVFATSYLYFRTASPPWDDERVRRAFAMLLPLDELRPKSRYLPSTSVLVPRIPGYPRLTGIAEQDRDGALALLRASGYPVGRGIDPVVVRVSGNAESIRIGGILERAWEDELEVDVIIEYGSSDPDDRSYTVGLSTWMGDYTDPLTFLSVWTSDSNLNDAGFSDTRYDETLVRAASFNREERFHTLAEAERLLLDTAVVLPISNVSAVNLIDTDRVAGWYANALDIHPFKYLRIVPLAPAPGIAMKLNQRDR